MNSRFTNQSTAETQTGWLARITLMVTFGSLQILVTPCLLGQTKLGTEFQPPQAVDGSRTSATSDSTATIQSQDSSSQPPNQLSRQQAFDLLVQEMNNLIPGELNEDPEKKRVVEDAVTAFQLRDAKRVIEIFNKHAASDTDFPPTELLLAGLSFAIQDAKTGRVLLERTGIQFPDSPAVYSAFARLAINEGRIVDSLALLEKMRVVSQADTVLSPEAKTFYGIQFLDGMTDVAMRQNRLDDADVYLTKQRSLNPSNEKVLMVSAELEFKQNNLDKSIEYLRELRAANPKTRVPETIIASWFQRTGNLEEAKKWIFDAAEKYTDDAQVQVEVASWAVNEEDFRTASASISKAEAASKETKLSKTLKAKIAFAGESYLVAEVHYESLWKMQPDNFDAANMYALCLIESDDEAKRQKARDLASQNFRALPDNVVAQAALGYIQLRLGEVEQAKSALGRALQSGSTSPEIEFFGASLLREMDETAKAKQVLENTLRRKGLFLYRASAKKMLAEIDANQLPAPATDK